MVVSDCKKCGFQLTLEFDRDVPPDELERHAARINLGHVAGCACGGRWSAWIRYGGPRLVV